jgi:uncharacterized protein YdaU (DUF1376 family)
MTDIPAMLLWTDAYLGDTSHLSTFEHGAYLLILMAMWRAGGTLPGDDETLARCARVTFDKWRKISPQIRAFLIPVAEMSQKSQSVSKSVSQADYKGIPIDNGHYSKNNGLVTQKRLWRELNTAKSRMEKRKSASFIGNRAKALKRQGPTPPHPYPYIKKDSLNGELRQEGGWVPTKRIGSRLFKVGELAPAYDGQPPSSWKKLEPKDCT